VFYLWWSGYDIHESGGSEYLAMDTSNSGICKYYIAKKTNVWYS